MSFLAFGVFQIAEAVVEHLENLLENNILENL